MLNTVYTSPPRQTHHPRHPQILPTFQSLSTATVDWITRSKRAVPFPQKGNLISPSFRIQPPRDRAQSHRLLPSTPRPGAYGVRIAINRYLTDPRYGILKNSSRNRPGPCDAVILTSTATPIVFVSVCAEPLGLGLGGCCCCLTRWTWGMGRDARRGFPRFTVRCSSTQIGLDQSPGAAPHGRRVGV